MPLVPLDEFTRKRGGLVPLSRNVSLAPREEEPGLISAAAQRGALTVRSDFAATTGLAAQLFGYDEAAQGFYNRAKELSDDASSINRRVGRVEDIKSLADVGIFALETLVENAPLLASLAIPGLTVAKVAGVAGRGAAQAAVKKGAKTALQAAADLSKLQKQSGTFAAFLSDVGLQTGESVGIAREGGADPLDIRMVGSGLGKGALDFVPILALARKLGLSKGLPFGKVLETNITKEIVERGFIRRALGNAATLMAFEIPTEVSQEIINIALDRSISQFEGQLTAEEKSQLLNAAGGAAAFGLLGVPAAVIRPRAGDPRPATDADLFAADNAPGPPPDLPALPPPDIAGLLPAPAIRVTPAGEAILPGTKPIDYDPAVDTPKTGTTVAEGVARALQTDNVPVQPTVFSVTEDGIVFPQIQDPHTVAADSLRELPEGARTPFEQSIITVDDARAATVVDTNNLIPLSDEKQQQYPVVVQTLLQARDDVFLNERFRRSADGVLTKEGKKRVAQLDKRIAAITKRLGLPNPLEAFGLQEITDADELSTFNAEEEARLANRPDSRLTPAESALLAKLEERDVERGLSIEEETIREGLIAKRAGEEELSKKKLSAEEVKQLRQEGAEIGDDESSQVFLREDELQQQLLLQVQTEAVQAETDRLELERRIEQVNNLEDRMINDGVNIADNQEVETFFRELLFRNVIDRNAEIRISPSQAGTQFITAVSSFPFRRTAAAATPKRLLKQFREAQTEAFGLRAQLVAQTEKAAQLVRRQTVLGSDSSKARFRRGQGQGMSISAVRAFITKAAAKLVNGPEIVIADTRDPNLFKGSTRKRELAGRAKGAFFTDEPNRVYIFANHINNELDLAQTFLHEIVTHFGFRAFFTQEEMNGILESIYKSRGNEIQERFGVPTSQTEALKFAEEFIAELSESGLDQSFLNRVIAFFRRAFRKIFPNTKFTDNDIQFMIRDIGRFLSGQIPSRNPGGAEAGMASDAFLRAAGRTNVESALPEMSGWRDVWGAKFQTWFLTPLQIAERNPIAGVQEYIELVQEWAARKNGLIKIPDDIAVRWLALPKKEGQILSQVLFETMEASELAGRALTPEEVAIIMRKAGASKAVFDMYREVRESFDSVLDLLQDRLELAAIREAVKDMTNPKDSAQKLHDLWKQDRTVKGNKAFIDRVASDESLKYFNLTAKLINIASELSVLRNSNYFPRMRFGQYAIIVRAQQDLVLNGRKFKGPRSDKLGEVVNYETFEDPEGRKQRRPSLEKQFKDQTKFQINEGYVADEEFSFLGMPPALFEALKSNLDLSPQQTEILKELYFRYSPGKAFLRHLTQRKGVEGYNVDAVRVYANYMMNAASHIARVEFSEDMQIQQKIMQNATREARQTTRTGILVEYFAKHFKYIMNPENDLATLRAVGFLFYLGFNVKSAAVNLTQVPMVAYPFLAHHYGDGAATAALARAYGSVAKRLTGIAVYDQDTDAAVTRGIEAGFLDESLVTEIAAIGEGEVLQRIMPENANIRLLNKVSYYGSFLFRHAEKINREIVFIATRELALKKNPGDQEGAFIAGRRAVQATMFEYKKWNRAAFMRGKKSVFFLFWQYMQHLSFIAYGGEGKGPALRVWAMLMFAAGLQGLPFAENIIDLLDFGGTQAKKALKMKDPRVTLREDLRELASQLTDKPDLIMHGMSRYYGLGPMHLLSAIGVPVPSTDISGSLSAGKVIPGTEQLLGPSDDPSAKFGRTIVEAMGPVAGIGYNFWKIMESDDPDRWKVWERALPAAIQGASKAVRRSVRGEETFRGGGAVATFDPQDTEQFLEAVAQGFSFATTRVNQRFELRASQEGLKQYWVIRRSKVLENFAWAILQEDNEAIAIATKRLNLFNKQAPAPGLRINAKKLRESVFERFRRGHLREVGLPNEKAFRGLYLKQQELFPEGAPEGST